MNTKKIGDAFGVLVLTCLAVLLVVVTIAAVRVIL